MFLVHCDIKDVQICSIAHVTAVIAKTFKLFDFMCFPNGYKLYVLQRVRSVFFPS